MVQWSGRPCVFFLLRVRQAAWIALSVLAFSRPSYAQSVDLSRATIAAPADADGPETAATELLIEETEKRTGIRWSVRAEEAQRDQASGDGLIMIGRRDQLLRASIHLAAWPPSDAKPE